MHTAKKQPKPALEMLTLDEYVGRRIRLARIGAGENQQELGKRLGVTYQQAQKYETGANKISFDKVYEIATGYGLPIGFFIDGYSPAGSAPEANQKLPADYRERATLQVASSFNKLDVKLQKTFSDLLTAIVKNRKGEHDGE